MPDSRRQASSSDAALLSSPAVHSDKEGTIAAVAVAKAKVDKMAGRQISFTKPKKKKSKKLQKGVRRSPRHKKSAPGQSSLSRSAGVRGLVVAETPAKELEQKAQKKQKGMNVARTSARHFVGESPAIKAGKSGASASFVANSPFVDSSPRRSPRGRGKVASFAGGRGAPLAAQPPRSLSAALNSPDACGVRRSPRGNRQTLHPPPPAGTFADDGVASTPRKGCKRALDLG